MSIRPAVARASVVTLVLLAVGLMSAPVAQAAAFRYWTYWQGNGSTWAFATQGPATAVPADGSVEGWRFAVTTQAGTGQDVPRATPDFAAICADTPSTPGKKRVALVIDSGPPAVAPEGQQPPATVATCVVAETDATGFAVLQSVAPVRTEGGLICSLADYPQGECAPILDDAEAQRVAQAAAASAAAPASSPSAATAPSSAATDSGSPVATIAVAGLLLAGAAVGALQYRRRTGLDQRRGAGDG